ncbi:hypothetical protein PR048_030581 [Dryococelus australis]|uniref:Uncharacterized protein n=1 Tax=Dryococelus australis TaxID=614101 RepID=A0ABQ9G9E9_9NEOP|nr:hypothetical protein PR048_030581 [Dryococelus australis]
MNAVKYRVLPGVVWTNRRTMVSSNTDVNRTGVPVRFRKQRSVKERQFPRFRHRVEEAIRATMARASYVLSPPRTKHSIPVQDFCRATSDYAILGAEFVIISLRASLQVNRWQHGLCRRRPASEHRSIVKTQITLVAGSERRTRRSTVETVLCANGGPICDRKPKCFRTSSSRKPHIYWHWRQGLPELPMFSNTAVSVVLVSVYPLIIVLLVLATPNTPTVLCVVYYWLAAGQWSHALTVLQSESVPRIAPDFTAPSLLAWSGERVSHRFRRLLTSRS